MKTLSATLTAVTAGLLALAASTAFAVDAQPHGRDLAGALMLDPVSTPLFMGAPDSFAAAGAAGAVQARLQTLRGQDNTLMRGTGLNQTYVSVLEPLVSAKWWSASQIGKIEPDAAPSPAEAKAMVRALVRGRARDVASHTLFFVSFPLDVDTLALHPVSIDNEGHFEVPITYRPRNAIGHDADWVYLTDDAALNVDLTPGVAGVNITAGTDTNRIGVSTYTDTFAIGTGNAGSAGPDAQSYQLHFSNLRGARLPAGILVSNARKFHQGDQLRFAIAFERQGNPLLTETGRNGSATPTVTQSVIARYAFIFDAASGQVLDGPAGMQLDGRGDDSRLLYTGPANCTAMSYSAPQTAITPPCSVDTNPASKGRFLQSETVTAAKFAAVAAPVITKTK